MELFSTTWCVVGWLQCSPFLDLRPRVSDLCCRRAGFRASRKILHPCTYMQLVRDIFCTLPLQVQGGPLASHTSCPLSSQSHTCTTPSNPHNGPSSRSTPLSPYPPKPTVLCTPPVARCPPCIAHLLPALRTVPRLHAEIPPHAPVACAEPELAITGRGIGGGWRGQRMYVFIQYTVHDIKYKHHICTVLLYSWCLC